MIGKMKLYSGLLVLGIVLIGSGVWLMLGSAQAKVSIPEGNPVIYEKLDYVMRGEFCYLYIYGDGSIIYIEEKGLRLPVAGHPPIRIWKTGKLQLEELNNLLEFIKNSGFEKLEEYYKFPGKPNEFGDMSFGDISCIITINYEGLFKKEGTLGYLTPDRGLTYPDMPYPLNDIYVKLRAIAQGTKEVARKNIS
jgi:hypothetical protein